MGSKRKKRKALRRVTRLRDWNDQLRGVDADIKARAPVEIADAVECALAVIGRCDPLQLLSRIVLPNCFNLGDEGALSSIWEPVAEYAQSLIMATEAWGVDAPGGADVEEFATALQDGLHACMSAMAPPFAPPKADAASEWGRREARLSSAARHLYIRGSAILEHDSELLSGLFAAHSQSLRASGLTTVEDLLEFCATQKLQMETTVQQCVEALLDIAEVGAARSQDKAVDSESVATEQAARTTLADAAQDGGLNLCRVGGSLDHMALERLSMRAGENADFLQFARSPGWPSNDTGIQSRPLIRRDDELYCMNPVLLMRSRHTIMENEVRRVSKKYFGNRYAKSRGKFAEQKALEYLGQILPDSQIFPNVFYLFDDKQSGQRFETDAIIVFGEYLFVVEVKSAPFSSAAMRSAPKSLQKDVGHLVDEPFMQAERVIRYIESTETAEFSLEDGTPALSIEGLGQFRAVHTISVTLADIGHVSTQMHAVRRIGMLRGERWPWSVYLNDLRVIADLIQSPADFILYLERRLALNDTPVLKTPDELDYLGEFLQRGLYLEPDHPLNEFHFITSSADKITRYYEGLAQRGPKSEKPTLNVTSWMRDLVTRVQASGSMSATTVAKVLLSMDGETQAQVEKWFESYLPSALAGRTHEWTMLGKELPPFVFALSGKNNVAYIERIRTYAQMKRLQTEKETLCLVALVGDSREVHVELFEGEHPQEAVDLLVVFRRHRVEEYLGAHGLPGANQPCPCNSNRKFKRCCEHRLRTGTWT